MTMLGESSQEISDLVDKLQTVLRLTTELSG